MQRKNSRTRDLFKKIGDIKEIFHARMGTIKGRYSKHLTETKEINKRCKDIKKNYSKKS